MDLDLSSVSARAVAAWSRFWFAPIPPHAYALLRILIGIIGGASVLGLHDIATYWAIDGLVP